MNEQRTNTASLPTRATREPKAKTTNRTGVREKINPCTFSNGSQSITGQSFSGIDLRSLSNAIAEIESAGSRDYKAIGIHTCADGGLNCGRALGRLSLKDYGKTALASYRNSNSSMALAINLLIVSFSLLVKIPKVDNSKAGWPP
ncbi:MAG: hypothetical protein V7L01_06510 [Nostoc sp.]|uniref:hypothetical protein n=1 Tax=Nostoc sp. TaxID=1180 RepID=UPI002FF48139